MSFFVALELIPGAIPPARKAAAGHKIMPENIVFTAI
jgi:hypothetical protein